MQEVDIIIEGGTILTLDDAGTVVPSGALAIEKDTIAAVGPLAEITRLYRGREVISAKRHVVMPGLVNAHTHAAMTCFRGIADDLELMEWLNKYIFPAEAKNVDPELAYWGSLLACAEMIRSGTTTFCDMYIFEDETAKAASRAGMRCLLGEVLFDFPSPNFKTPDEGLARTKDLIEKWAGDPLVHITVEPHALYTCSEDLLKKSRALAEEYRVPLSLHLLETKSERAGLMEKLGCSPVQYLRDIGLLNENLVAFHCVWLTPEDIEMFARHRGEGCPQPREQHEACLGCRPRSRDAGGRDNGRAGDGRVRQQQQPGHVPGDGHSGQASQGLPPGPHRHERRNGPENGDALWSPGPRDGGPDRVAAARDEGRRDLRRFQPAPPDSPLS